MNSIKRKLTGSIDSIDAKPITRAEPSDIDFILNEWEKGKIHTKYTREELKRIIVKTGDYEYLLDIPVKDIIDETIKFILIVKPSLFDPTSIPNTE